MTLKDLLSTNGNLGSLVKLHIRETHFVPIIKTKLSSGMDSVPKDILEMEVDRWEIGYNDTLVVDLKGESKVRVCDCCNCWSPKNRLITESNFAFAESWHPYPNDEDEGSYIVNEIVMKCSRNVCFDCLQKRINEQNSI